MRMPSGTSMVLSALIGFTVGGSAGACAKKSAPTPKVVEISPQATPEKTPHPVMVTRTEVPSPVPTLVPTVQPTPNGYLVAGGNHAPKDWHPRPGALARPKARLTPSPTPMVYYVPAYAQAQVTEILRKSGVPLSQIRIIDQVAPPASIPPALMDHLRQTASSDSGFVQPGQMQRAAGSGFPTSKASPGGSVGVGYGGITEDMYLRVWDQYGVLSAAREDAYFRTNVAAVWTGGWVTVRFESYSASGIVIGSYNWDTRWASALPDGLAQFNSIATAWNLAPRSTDTPWFSTKIFITGGPGKVCFYQTVIDNGTGDPVFYYSTRFPGAPTPVPTFTSVPTWTPTRTPAVTPTAPPPCGGGFYPPCPTATPGGPTPTPTHNIYLAPGPSFRPS